MDNPTLYTGAYLVAGIQGYTKHYYAGSERISSAIGLGGLANINDPLSIEKYENWKIKAGSLKDEMSRTINECLKNEYDIKNSLEFLHGMEEAAAGTMDRYFYHPDHLGSSSWITDGKGYAIQHLHYLPFGEDWVDQRNASWNAPYTFSGKEKDVETGYSYFGARYYDSGLSIWLSVDPMSDKYPNLTPYAYCANNPVILVDPDGREFVELDIKFDVDEDPTRYRNTKGELLYETLDNQNVDIIVPETNVPELERELQTAKDNGTINDPETNRQKMHTLGKTPHEYTKEKTRGMPEYWVNGYEQTYQKAYKEGKNQWGFDHIIFSIVAAIAQQYNDNSGLMLSSGRTVGISDGNHDRKMGLINRLNPYSSFKNNSPIIILN
jgi:RHS repeat-associated protein